MKKEQQICSPGFLHLPCHLESIQALFYHLNELVYMTDMDTNELIYLNKSGLEKYGFDSVEQLKGLKCYDVLQNNSSPCSFCTNSELVPLKYTEWKIYNPVIKRHYMLKDTMICHGDKRYRLEIAVDISDSEKIHAAVQNYQDLEKVANEGVRQALEASTPDESINCFLEYLGKALKGDRAYIFEKNENGYDDNTYEWVASGIEPQIHNLQNLPPEVCSVWYKSFENGNPVSIANIEEIRELDPEQYQVLAPQGIQSVVVVPIFLDGNVIGFYGIDNPPVSELEYTYHLLNIVGHFFTSAMKRRRLVRELHSLSHKDSFTMLGNRLAMKEYISSVHMSESMGVLYCDITGLKFINDTYGHSAGDQLILNACSCMKKIFPKESLFRIGGDELLMLCQNISREELENKIQSFKKLLEKNSVVLAIGMEYTPLLSTSSVEQLMKEAEKKMYEDKSLYYRQKGLDRRNR